MNPLSFHSLISQTLYLNNKMNFSKCFKTTDNIETQR